mmetsp:Transcript_10664/g.19286  ORF Transcript_10664/g.19286 Transcript_10664/m.19286 type:complete len:107 (-) Transcript_10664:1474-1794(-)
MPIKRSWKGISIHYIIEPKRNQVWPSLHQVGVLPKSPRLSFAKGRSSISAFSKQDTNNSASSLENTMGGFTTITFSWGPSTLVKTLYFLFNTLQINDVSSVAGSNV